MEGLFFHCILSVCVCVCVRLCLWLKLRPNGCTDLDAVFAKQLLSTLAQTLIKFVTLGQRPRSQWIKIHFLTSLSYISALVHLIKLKFGLPLWYALCRFVVEFYKNQMGDDVIVTSFQFSPYKCPYFKSTEPTNFIFGTNIQQHKVHLMIKMKLTLTDDKDHRQRS